jgi:DNA-binding beta-propeller fold protein YncE
MSRFLLLMAAGAILLGAQTPLGGPSLGYIFDERGQTLRPILGIPGASLFGDPWATTGRISIAAVSAQQNVAIVNDGVWKAIVLAGGSVTALPGGLPSPAQLAVSENGTAAAFYDAGKNALSVVTGIAGSSMAANSVSLAALPGAITVFAAGDDGSLLLSASVPAGGEALFWIGADGNIYQLASLQATASIQIFNQGASALVVDRAANQVFAIQNPGATAAVTLVASGADGVSSPSGAAFSAGGTKLWIANAGAGSVLGIDMNTRATVSLNCAFELKTMESTGDGQTFRLNRLRAGPLWLLDATPGADPRVVFVPAIQPAITAVSANVEVAQ